MCVRVRAADVPVHESYQRRLTPGVILLKTGVFSLSAKSGAYHHSPEMWQLARDYMLLQIVKCHDGY